VKFIFLLLTLLSGFAQAHEVSLITQHISLKKQHQSGWQQDVIARAAVSRNFDVGLQGTYLERFDLFENRVGGYVMYHPTNRLTLDARYLRGKSSNQILPLDQFDFSAYYALFKGYTPYLFFRDARYSSTDLQTITLGAEIEKISHFIIIPQVMFGSATFRSPSESKNVHGFSLKVMYYVEKQFSLFAYGSSGKEASQGIVGQGNLLVDTLTGGLGAGYFLTPSLRSELFIDHTDYQELKNQFLTTTFQLRWMF
jgi:hypothetical protein